MADKFKDKDKNNNGIPDHLELIGIILFILVIATVLVSVFNRIKSFLMGTGFFGGPGSTSSFAGSFVEGYLPLLRVMSVVFSVTLIIFLVYVIRETNKILVKERAKLGQSIQSEGEAFEYKNERWERVVKLINSTNPGDWKLSIMEADIILDELLDRLGYTGDSIGDKLKQIEASDFNTLNQAWEAHKVRNNIAHEGADYLITERESKRIIGLFEEVFTEFRYI